MAAPIFQRTLVDSDGNVEIGAIVEVRNEANNELAPIFVDRALTIAKENPFITDETGMIEFFVERGEYKVRANSGDNEITWRYVQMLDTEFVASTDTAQTLTNKTITFADNTLTGVQPALGFTPLNKAGDTMTGDLTVTDSLFTIENNLNNTKKARFDLNSITAGTSRTYTLPNINGMLAFSSNNAQTFTGTTTFSNATVTVGTAVGASTYGLATGATTTGLTKAVNIGTAGLSGSTTNIAIGSSVAGATTNVTASGTWTYANTIVGSITGSAATLTTARTINGTSFNGSANITTDNWGTARTLSFTGDVTGSSSVNGSANVATAITLANSGVTAASYGGNNSIPSLTVDAKGRVTAASVVVPSGTWAISISGVAATATILATARTIGGVSFNGSANIDLPGVNTAGNQNTSGNAATATALQTARTIGGVSFDGTANINLPGVNTAGNQNTTGTAANVTGTVAVANGGTGRTSLTTGNVVLGAGTSAVNFVAPSTSGNVLTSNGTTWVSAPPPASGGGVTVSATAPVSPSDGDLWYDTTASALKIRISSAWLFVSAYS